jgi:hypothetical protein
MSSDAAWNYTFILINMRNLQLCYLLSYDAIAVKNSALGPERKFHVQDAFRFCELPLLAGTLCVIAKCVLCWMRVWL